MIIVFPIVVSKTVDPNILPGVCKALEKYVYVYRLDEVLDTANKNIADNNRTSGVHGFIDYVGGMLRFENFETDPSNFIEEAKGSNVSVPGTTSGTGPRPNIKTGPPSNARSSSNAKSPSNATTTHNTTTHNTTTTTNTSPRPEIRVTEPRIGNMDSDSITAEPTWNVVTDQLGRTTTIGVKVVPFIINNEESLVALMTLDRYREKLSSTIEVQARRILRFMHNLGNRAWRQTMGRFLSWTGFIDKDLVAGTITQNWKNDIILQNTAFGDRMFVLLNKMDLEDDFLTSAKGVKKLFGLGWTSFIIADDINKTVNFCMKEYKGLCSTINYGFLYSDARTKSQVYQDISDIRKSSGPLFRMKGNRKTMMLDNLALQKIATYSEITESYMTEGAITDLFQQLKDSPTLIVSNLRAMSSAIKRNDFKTVKNIVKKFNPGNKQINIDEVINKQVKLKPEFKKQYELSKAVFKNSLPGLDEEANKAASVIIAGIASLSRDKNYDIKNDLKKIVTRTRETSKTLEEDDDNFAKDLKLSFIFSVFYVVFQGALFVTLLWSLTIVFPTIAASVSVMAFVTGILIAIVFIIRLLSGV